MHNSLQLVIPMAAVNLEKQTALAECNLEIKMWTKAPFLQIRV